MSATPTPCAQEIKAFGIAAVAYGDNESSLTYHARISTMDECESALNAAICAHTEEKVEKYKKLNRGLHGAIIGLRQELEANQRSTASAVSEATAKFKEERDGLAEMLVEMAADLEKARAATAPHISTIDVPFPSQQEES